MLALEVVVLVEEFVADEPELLVEPEFELVDEESFLPSVEEDVELPFELLEESEPSDFVDVEPEPREEVPEPESDVVVPVLPEAELESAVPL